MLVAVASAKGSPGVTTTARVLASVWPVPPVLADLDPVGGDLPFVTRTTDERPLDTQRGLLSLAAAARRGPIAGVLHEHVQVVEGGLEVLVGVQAPEQMTGIGPAMATVAAGLATCGRDVVVDLGRLSPLSPVVPVALAADVVVLVVRPRVEAFAHLRERLRWLGSLTDGHGRSPAVAAVVVTAPHDKRSARDLEQLLAHSGLAVPVLGQVADDARAADVLAGRLSRGIDRSLLVRSVRQVVEPVRRTASLRVPVTHY